MAYGTLAIDTIQSSTTGTPTQFQDGSGTQIGTLARAWVQFAGASGTRNGYFNVSSVTRNSTGNYTVNFTNAMPNANYSAVAALDSGAVVRVPTYVTSSVTVLTYNTSFASFDATTVSVAVFS